MLHGLIMGHSGYSEPPAPSRPWDSRARRSGGRIAHPRCSGWAWACANLHRLHRSVRGWRRLIQRPIPSRFAISAGRRPSALSWRTDAASMLGFRVEYTPAALGNRPFPASRWIARTLRHGFGPRSREDISFLIVNWRYTHALALKQQCPGKARWRLARTLDAR